jgi:hypothetical protein
MRHDRLAQDKGRRTYGLEVGTAITRGSENGVRKGRGQQPKSHTGTRSVTKTPQPPVGGVTDRGTVEIGA